MPVFCCNIRYMKSYNSVIFQYNNNIDYTSMWVRSNCYCHVTSINFLFLLAQEMHHYTSCHLVTLHNHNVPCQNIKTLEASHYIENNSLHGYSFHGFKDSFGTFSLSSYAR